MGEGALYRLFFKRPDKDAGKLEPRLSQTQ
jgi:hypothetical protein